MAHVVVEGFEPIGHDLDPAGHARAGQLHAIALIDAALTVERKMIEILGEDELDEQLNRGDPLDHSRGGWGQQGWGLALIDSSELATHDGAAIEASRHAHDFKGALFTDLFKGLWIGLDLLRIDDRFLFDREVSVLILPRGSRSAAGLRRGANPTYQDRSRPGRARAGGRGRGGG